MKSIDPQTATLWDNDHFMHPWEGMAEIGHNARSQIDSAGGIYVTDTSGRTLIDGPGGMWCVQIGYGRDEMADAMAERVRSMSVDDSATSQVAIRVALGREPEQEEIARADKFLRENSLESFCLTLMNLSEFVYIN